MPVNKVAFTAVGLACIAAAGAGGYFALRQNTAPVQPAPIAASAPVTTTADNVPAEPARTDAPSRDVEVVAPSKPARSSKKVVEPEPAKPERAPVQSVSAAPLPKLTPPAPVAAPVAPPAPEPIAPPAPVERAAQEPPPPPAPPQHTFDELVISKDSVIGLQSDTAVSSETARVEDRVEARVTRDVKVADRVAIPAGARAIGYVTQVERGGKFKEQAKLSIRFQTIVLADGTRLPISTAAVEREGDTKGGQTAAKVGGAAVAGTILGAILGGGKGAAVGGLAGAGAGTAVTAAGDRSVAQLRAGEPITIRLLSPATVTIESK